MRFIVALLIASLFVDKADSNCLSFQGITFRSQQYSHPYPITSIPRASYSFSFDHRGASQNRKLTLGLGIIRLELMTSTTSR
uniref:Secreted protein n=1 Tax=Spirodela intermedia TaxID=51605 RepID=A0A8S0XAC1_SPIIN